MINNVEHPLSQDPSNENPFENGFNEVSFYKEQFFKKLSSTKHEHSEKNRAVLLKIVQFFLVHPVSLLKLPLYVEDYSNLYEENSVFGSLLKRIKARRDRTSLIRKITNMIDGLSISDVAKALNEEPESVLPEILVFPYANINHNIVYFLNALQVEYLLGKNLDYLTQSAERLFLKKFPNWQPTQPIFVRRYQDPNLSQTISSKIHPHIEDQIDKPVTHLTIALGTSDVLCTYFYSNQGKSSESEPDEVRLEKIEYLLTYIHERVHAALFQYFNFERIHELLIKKARETGQPVLNNSVATAIEESLTTTISLIVGLELSQSVLKTDPHLAQMLLHAVKTEIRRNRSDKNKAGKYYFGRYLLGLKFQKMNPQKITEFLSSLDFEKLSFIPLRSEEGKNSMLQLSNQLRTYML